MKMNKVNNIFRGLLAILVFTSCADEDLGPTFTYETAGKGSYPKLVTLTSGEYDLQDIAGSAFTYEVEFVDINQGKATDLYEIYVSFNGGDYVLYRSYTQSEFSDSPNGLRGLSISLPFTEAASLIGEDPGTMVPGDFFTVDTRVTSDGVVFTQDNSSAAINSTAFAGFFRNRVNVTCPLPDEEFAGDYTLSYTSAHDGLFGDFFNTAASSTMTLELIAGSTTRRSFDFDYSGLGFPTTWTLDFLCDEVLSSSWDLSASCGAGSITADGINGTFDINDDSSFTFSLIETDDGACGGTIAQIDLEMTKN